MEDSAKRFVLDVRTATDHFPGIARYVSNLARAIPGLLRPGEQLIILRNRSRSPKWPLPKSSRQVVMIDLAKSPFSLAQQWQIPALLQRHRASMYHSPYYLMPYWLPVPSVVTIFDLIPRLVPNSVTFLRRILFESATRLALRTAAKVLVPSQATKMDLTGTYSRLLPSMEVTELAAEAHFRSQSAEDISRVRKKQGLARRYVLFVGINKPHKNLPRLIDAWKLVTTRIPSATLVLAGPWDRRFPEPEVRARHLGLDEKILFLGPVPEDDLPALYAGADLFILPSLYEGFGLPVLEAMACGTPVACSRRSALPEVGGSATAYFDPSDIQDLSRQILRLLEDATLRESLRVEGLRRAAKFSWEETARKTLQVYREISN